MENALSQKCANDGKRQMGHRRQILRRRVEVMLAKGRAWAAVTGLASWENRGLKRRQKPPVSAAIFPETCVVV